MQRGTMEMEGLLDMLQEAREKTGVVGIVHKPRDEQAKILESLMHKFDAAKDTQITIDSRWGFDKKESKEDDDMLE